MLRSSLLTGAVTMAATLVTFAATLSSGAEAWAQQRRGAAVATANATVQHSIPTGATPGTHR
jgi:hypothetical protein